MRGSDRIGWTAGAALVLLAGAASAADVTPALSPVYAAATAARDPAAALRPDQAALLVLTLSQAETQGFEPDAFMTPALQAMLQSADPQTRRAGYADLVSATLRYARSVHAGQLAPGAFLDEWGLRPAPYDPTPDFLRAVAEDRLGAWLDSLPPRYPAYESLRNALMIYRAIAAKGGWGVLGPGHALKLGVADRRVPALRARLAIEDPTTAATGPAVYDRALARAVARAQKRFGLAPSGVLDQRILSALNVPVQERVAQIQANMERWRWLPPALPADRIQVSIDEETVTLFRDDAPVLTMRAVTGRPGDETPMLQAEVDSIVINPPWDVPDDIATKELWPKERAHPGFFVHNDFVVIPDGDGGTRLQQKAGPKAALGDIMFDLPNRFGVYLHDTRVRSVFGQSSRRISHGCVRLEKPLALADMIMAGDPRWTPAMINQTIAGGDTVRAPLQHPVAVFLVYWTADVGPDGQVNFHDDPYGWDGVLRQRLDAVAHGGA